MKAKDQQDSNDQKPLSLGAMLKERRQSLGYSIQVVANELRLKPGIIIAIENDSDIKIDDTFYQGYLRSYSRLLGFSDKEVNPFLTKKPQANIHQSASVDNFPLSFNNKRKEKLLTIITWLIILCVLSLSAIWWWQRHNNNSDNIQRDNVSSKQEVETKQLSLINQNLDDYIAPNEENSNTASNSKDEQSHLENDAFKDNNPYNIEEKVSNWQIKFLGECWVDIRDKDKNVIARGIYRQGDILVLKGKLPYDITIGAPKLANIFYNDNKINFLNSNINPDKAVKLLIDTDGIKKA